MMKKKLIAQKAEKQARGKALDEYQRKLREVQDGGDVRENSIKERELKLEYSQWLRDPNPLAEITKYKQNEPVSYENMRKMGVYDVLDYSAEEVIDEFTYKNMYSDIKKSGIVHDNIIENENEGQMFDYQRAFMDEHDVATHDYRDEQTDRTLDSFINEESDIFESYKEKPQEAVKDTYLHRKL